MANMDDLAKSVKEKVIVPAEEKVKELRKPQHIHK
jgi:hypothetical protein